MELKNMTIEELEARKNDLVASIDNEGADLDSIESEVRAIKEEMESRKAVEAKKNEVRSLVANGAGEVVKKVEREERNGMKVAEIRASKEYVDAYAEGIKNKDMSVCRSMLLEAEDLNAEERALLTTNGGGTVSVPTMVEDFVKNAWEQDEIARRVKKTYLKGNLKVDFELSSDGATVQAEGQAVNEENLVLGTVDLTPEMILKWVSITVQAADLRGEAFLQYVYDELVHKIAEKAVDRLIAKIEACGTQATTNAVGVPKVTSSTVSIGTIASAMAELSAQATNPVIIMNRKSWGEFKKVQANNKYAYDPFEGLEVLYNNSIKDFATATTGDTYAIVGDLGEGAQFNFPSGEEIDIVEDRLTLATAGKVKEIGSQFVGIGVVGPDAFVKVTK
jgi:HK97 family phage major capsid protein